MRSTAWIGSGAALGLPLLGISLGAALAGLVALGGAGGALAQGMMMPMEGYGYRSGKAATGYRAAAKPAPRAKKRYYRSPTAVKTCGQFKYLSKGKCLDARTTPPTLK
ncbi:MAG: hypothetical protein WAN86_27170 [Hyphomicrobiaceae bacterium]